MTCCKKNGNEKIRTKLNNKLKRVLPKLNENHTPKGMTRRDGTVCARLRIGHSDSLLSPKRRTAFLRQLQRSTDNKPLTNKLC